MCEITAHILSKLNSKRFNIISFFTEHDERAESSCDNSNDRIEEINPYSQCK